MQISIAQFRLRFKHLFVVCLLITCQWTIAQTQSPRFEGCEDQQCSNTKYTEYLRQMIKDAHEMRGLIVKDSVFMSYEVQNDGQLKINSTFSIVSDELLKFCKSRLQDMKGLLSAAARGQSYEVVLSFGDDIKHISSDLYAAEEVPTLVDCRKFNDIGQKACLNYLKRLVRDSLSWAGFKNSSLAGKLYFKRGVPAQLVLNEAALDKHWNDQLIQTITRVWNYFYAGYNKPKEMAPFYFHFEMSAFDGKPELYDYYKRYAAESAAWMPESQYISNLEQILKRYYTGDVEKNNELLKAAMESGKLSEKAKSDLTAKMLEEQEEKEDEEVDEDESLSFAIVETLPIYPGCEDLKESDELMQCFQRQIGQHVGKSYKFPDKARDAGIQGRVFVKFVIERDGSIGSIEVLRGVHILLDVEAIRVVSEIPDMISPAYQRGKAVRMSFTLPFSLKLQ